MPSHINSIHDVLDLVFDRTEKMADAMRRVGHDADADELWRTHTEWHDKMLGILSETHAVGVPQSADDFTRLLELNARSEQTLRSFGQYQAGKAQEVINKLLSGFRP